MDLILLEFFYFYSTRLKFERFLCGKINFKTKWMKICFLSMWNVEKSF